jgi:hypothetical protein
VAVALDNAPAMLARAAQRAREQRCEQSVAVVSGDMTAFDVDAVTAAKRVWSRSRTKTKRWKTVSIW